jgi:hypothetical protein
MKKINLLCTVFLSATLLSGCGTDISEKFTVAVVGDMPYGTSIADTSQYLASPAFISQINKDSDVSAVLHLGDLHSGKEPCTETYNKSILDLWKSFRMPVVYTPGDNEWADCHKAKQYGGAYNSTTGVVEYYTSTTTKGTIGPFFSYQGGDPLANLDLIRSLFFTTAGIKLTGSLDIHSQSKEFDPAYPADANYVENVWWMKSNVMFVTLNIPGGSNNDTDIWYGAPSMSSSQTQEIANRSGANKRWLNTAFSQAKSRNAIAVVIQVQGDMWDLDGNAAGLAHLTEYKQFTDSIASNTASFAKPVLLLNGDSHKFRVDNPLKANQPCYTEPFAGGVGIEACTNSNIVTTSYPLDPYNNNQVGSNYSASNFRRIVVHGSTSPMEYLKLTVDPSKSVTTDSATAFGPFSWSRVQLQ